MTPVFVRMFVICGPTACDLQAFTSLPACTSVHAWSHQSGLGHISQGGWPPQVVSKHSSCCWLNMHR